MEKLRNLKDHICSFENLLCAYKEAARDKRYRNEVIVFSFNLEENLLDIQQDLLNQTYEMGRYREFYVRYPKARLVMALGFRDRIVQWAIYRQINPFVDKRLIQHSYGCRKGKGTLAAAQCLLNWIRLINRKPDARNWAIIKGDISKYFYRVDHEIIMSIYKDICDEEWFLWLMGTIIDSPELPFGLPEGASIDDCPRDQRLYDVGMPIGNLTSQQTANLYLDRLDRYVKHKLQMHYYVRYMDDFIILAHRADARRILSDITEYLRTCLHLTISTKSRILPVSQPVEFVGYSVSPHGLRLRRKTTKHIKHSLKHKARQYAKGDCTLEEAIHTTTSYWGMTANCNGYGLRLWIENNIGFQRREAAELPEAMIDPENPAWAEVNSAAVSPGGDVSPVRQDGHDAGKRFYTVVERGDGTVDVYLNPDARFYNTDLGVREYDITVRIVRGVVPWDGIEDDIRARYDAWCETAEVVNL